MKLILENWRKFINEASTAENYYFIITPKQNSFRIEAMSEEMQPVISKRGEPNSYLSMEKRTGENNYEVATANSPKGSKGVGLTMYKIAIELAGDKGLSPDSYDTSPDALRVWQILMKDPRISLKEKDPYGDEKDPINNIFYSAGINIISQLNNRIIFKEKIVQEPEELPIEEPDLDINDWESLYDDDILN